jgi:hypothetical protein
LEDLLLLELEDDEERFLLFFLPFFFRLDFFRLLLLDELLAELFFLERDLLPCAFRASASRIARAPAWGENVRRGAGPLSSTSGFLGVLHLKHSNRLTKFRS